MDTNTRANLAATAAQARLLGLEMVYSAASGHLGGSFSAMDAMTVLYFDIMRIDPARPQDPDRDRFVLSKGHCTPALYLSLIHILPWRINQRYYQSSVYRSGYLLYLL